MTNTDGSFTVAYSNLCEQIKEIVEEMKERGRGERKMKVKEQKK